MNRTLHLVDTPARPPLAEHARVRLREALPKYHLRAGETGTVVYLYDGGEGLEVEFRANTPEPEVVTLRRDAVEPTND